MVFASDLEGTLTTGYTWKGMASYLKAQGRGLAYRAFLASRLHQTLLYYARLIDPERYKNRWIEGLLGLFRGMTTPEFETVAEWVVEQEMWPKRREDIIAHVQRHREAGARVILTSGGFTPIVGRFATRIGVTEVIATSVEMNAGRMTGRVTGPHNTGLRKADSLRAYLDGDVLDVAYGDTFPDHPMLELSADPVAVYPDDDLARLAHQRGWRILPTTS
jgi:phosphoserine phosphatase